MRNAAIGGAVGGSLTTVAVGAQAVFEAYLPAWLPALPLEDVPLVAAGIVVALGAAGTAAYRAGVRSGA